MKLYCHYITSFCDGFYYLLYYYYYYDYYGGGDDGYYCYQLCYYDWHFGSFGIPRPWLDYFYSYDYWGRSYYLELDDFISDFREDSQN